MRQNKHFLIVSISVILAGLCTLGSCNKSDRDEDTETLSARDYALAHHIFDDAFRQVHRFAMADTLLNDTSVTQSLDKCLHGPTTFVSDTVAIFPLTLQLNYSDLAKPCYDQGLRYGIINAEFTGKYLNKGSVISISFKDYRKGVYDVEGDVLVVNRGLNNSGRRHYSMIINNGVVTGNNVRVDISGAFRFVWDSGSSTETEFDDDVFEIDSGAVVGRNSRGSSFTNEITAEFVSDFSCAHFTEGRSYMEVQNLLPRYINYGDGTCDNLLTSKRSNTFLEVEIPIMPLATF